MNLMRSTNRKLIKNTKPVHTALGFNTLIYFNCPKRSYYPSYYYLLQRCFSQNSKTHNQHYFLIPFQFLRH
jgi:hypothetical protein